MNCYFTSVYLVDFFLLCMKGSGMTYLVLFLVVLGRTCHTRAFNLQ